MADSKLPEEMYFYLSNGDKLTSLDDLIYFLEKGNQDIFSNHVTNQKNDFYNWVKFALKDESSAEKIRSAKTIGEMLDSLKSIYSLKDSHPLENAGVLKEGTAVQPIKEKHETTKIQSSAKKNARARDLKKTNDDVPLNKTSKSKKTKRVKTKHELSYSPDFDYSLDLDEQRDALAQIRKRIEDMDLGLKSYSSSSSKKTSPKVSLRTNSVKDKQSQSNKISKDYFSKSLDNLDDKYPELSHKEITREQLNELKSSKPRKRIHHHIKSASSHISKRITHHAKNIHGYVSDRIQNAKKQAKISKMVSSNNQESKKTKSVKEQNRKIKYEMEQFYGKPVDDSEKKSTNVKEKKHKTSFFGSLVKKFKKSEAAVAKDLPDLHEFEHAKKAQEFLTSDVVVDADNYHMHGVQDFFKGLIIGILIGMLFLAIF